MIEYRARAVADVESIADFISLDNPDAGQRFIDAFLRSARVLSDSPHIGRQRQFRRPDLAGVRSWPVEGFPNHFIFYRVTDAGVLVVLRVIHGAREIRAALFDVEPD